MADNTALNTMTGGDTIGADEISSVKYQRIKLIHGADGVNDGDVATGNPLPTVQTGALPAGTALVGKVSIDQATANANEVVTKTGSKVVLEAGTAGIGKLTANSGVDIGDVDVTSAPVRDRLTDNQGVALQTDAIMNDTTALTPKYAVIDHATSGENTILALVAGKKIRVLAVFMVSAGDVTARFESDTAGTALTGQMTLTTNSGFVLPFNPVGWFETVSGELLNLELSGAISVDGSLVYVEI